MQIHPGWRVGRDGKQIGKSTTAKKLLVGIFAVIFNFHFPDSHFVIAKTLPDVLQICFLTQFTHAKRLVVFSQELTLASRRCLLNTHKSVLGKRLP